MDDETVLTLAAALIEIAKLGQAEAGKWADPQRVGYIEGLRECAAIAQRALDELRGDTDD